MTNNYNATQTYHAQKFGSMSISKGFLTSKDDPDFKINLYTWDAIQECRDETCPANHYCNFDRTGKCSAMQKFLKACASALVFRSNEDIDQDAVFRIGTELIPLYGQLMRFWIEELGVRDDVTYTSRGKKSMHPIFKEIRETIKLIGVVRQKIGIGKGTEVLPPQRFIPGAGVMTHARKPRGSYT